MAPPRVAVRASLVLSALVSYGCSAAVAEDVDVSDAGGSTTQALVRVERATAVDGAAKTHVSAKFMRLTGSADLELAERVVGSRLDLPSQGECIALTTAAADDDAWALAGSGPVELLDVGDVTLGTDEDLMFLAARAFPDVADLVSGVFYTSDDASSDLRAPARYTVAATGAGSLPSFAVDVDAPSAPEDVDLDGTPLAEIGELDDRFDLKLRWAAPMRPSSRGTLEDFVYVDLVSSSGSGLRCAFADEGEGRIPARWLGADVLGPLPDSATLSVHRVRLRSFDSAGVDHGEVRFDLSVVAQVRAVSSTQQ